MIQEFFFLLVLFLDINSIIVRGLEVVYYQDFTPSLSCSNIFSQYWSIVSGSFSGVSCQYQCDRSDNGNNADIFSPEMFHYPSGFQMIKSITQPYSFFGVDLVYLRNIDPLNMNIFDGDTSLFSQNYSGARTGTNIEYNYSLRCNHLTEYIQVSKETVQLNQSLTSNNIKVQFQQHVTQYGNSLYGILKLRVWANCVENCDICLDSANCSKCLLGFDKYTIQSGQKVCEQTQNCNISNCFSCIKNSPSSLTFTCVKCLPGYSLDTNKNCIANPGGDCPANQYQSTVSGCQTYSTQCYIQLQNTHYTWQICPGQVDLSLFKCLNSKAILIYEHKNYSLNTCGCPIINCIQCPNLYSCSQCQLGFTYDPTTYTCNFVRCPVLYSRDPQTGLCSKNCSGNDCQQCNQNQQCTLCNPTGNYFIVTANPINCALCTIQNCSNCSGEGLCQNCQNHFSLSLDRTACNPCNVNNCSQCVIGQPSLCQTCIAGYIQSSDKTTCSCSVQNCQACKAQEGTICDFCVNGYLISLDKKQCSCAVPNCSQCNLLDGTQCQTCISGYNLNPLNSKCLCSVSNCQTCNSSNGNLCDSCITNYAPIGIQSPICTCQVYGCQTCTPLNGLMCQICYSNFIISQSGTCLCNVQNCSQCSATDGNICNTCVNNYLLSSSKTSCDCQVNSCNQCDSNNGKICISPKPGYTYDPINQINKCNFANCQRCDPNDGSICLQCQNGYNFNSNQCQCNVANCQTCNSSNGNLCDRCITNYAPVGIQSPICTCQVYGCQTCTPLNGLMCQICYSNFIISQSGTCLCNVQNCSQCSATDGNICNTCVNNYLLSSSKTSCHCQVNSCNQCDQNNGKICISPKPGYTYDPMSQTNKCNFANCQRCDPNDGSICLQCQNGYQFSSNQCQCNVSNCQTCNSSNGNLCDSCITNYAPIGTQSPTCTCQVYGCQTCTPLNGLMCQICYSNFIISQNGSCLCKVQNCSQCSATDGNICNTCVNNYLLSSSKTSCDCQVNSCNQCDSNNGKICISPKPGYTYDPINQTNKCNFANCQRCDPNDGNICLQCQNGYHFSSNQCQCNAQFCQKCDPLNGSICQQCISEYHLNPIGQTIQCQLNCSLDNCKECQDPPNNKTQCKSCNSGYVLDPSTNQCVSTQCKVPQCSQCKPYKPNLCQTCNDKYNLDSDSQCNLSIKNDFSVQQTVIQNVGYNVTLNFKNQIVADDQNLDSQLNIQIKDYVNPFQVSILQAQEKSIKIQLKLQYNCKNKNLVVQMKDLSFVQINNLVDPQKEVKLDEYVVLSESQIKQSQQTKQVASGASKSLLIMGILMIVIGNTYVLFSTIDLTTFIYFMLFIDVRYPDNVMLFCQIFQNFQFAFIPNSIQVYLMNPNYTQPYTPKKFIDNGYDSYFLNGAGQSLTTMAGIMVIYGVIKILSYIPITSIRVYIRRGLVIPQNDQNSKEQNKKQDNKMNECYLKTSNENKSLQKIEHEKLTRQKQLQYKWSRYTNVILYARKTIYILVLLYFYGQVYIQMVIINSMNVLLSIYYLYIKPQQENSANIKNGISEVLLVIMQATVCFLVKDDESQREEDRFNIGWIIVGSASLILTIHIFSVIVDLLKGIYYLVKDFITTLIKPKAEIEKLKQEKLAEEQNKQNKFLKLTSQISIDKLRNMKKKISLVHQSQLDISILSIQRHQIKQKSIKDQPKNNESNHIIELQKQSENCDQLNKHSLKVEKNQIKKNEKENISFELENSPNRQKFNLQNSFINNHINNLTTHQLQFSPPQSINISNNYILSTKNRQQVFL
ncbi:hypothetical protein TTHERM_00746890 (macronuclear) [Tetrahymena thermophila SB210]|uniref:EGF-like domain-containing protein n=1 Tax=Tetrahymena thermophila (strain SB210) TaxID=312017 RepID=Q239U1_TETTS|nr:hypothetical protein TTHERM_00746890 [Tetrahymena thermophila SB210]EAR93317.2 hypothetical protein TTHERM_00746890 [Tetrahymena thermophila SB210]|eukprot:XP_001013562.2 hypothetical protein TTHERM_00746890 [Tetrahymena thermophila SB210]